MKKSKNKSKNNVKNKSKNKSKNNVKNKSKNNVKNKSKNNVKNKSKNNVKNKSLKKKCFKIYNPYHEALVYEKIGPGGGGNRPIKNVDKKWDEFIKYVNKEGYSCIKYPGGLENEKYQGKMIEKKV